MAFYKVCGNYYGTDNDANSLKHYRTPGSKNGVRKYQYEDGTLTPAGRIHYGVGKGGAANSATAYTDKGTGSGGPKGAAGLAYRLGGAQGYNNYRKAASNVNEAVGNVKRWGSNLSKSVADALGYQDEGARLNDAQRNYFSKASPLHEGTAQYEERKQKQDYLNEVANRYNTAPYGANSTDRREWDARRMETGAELQRLQNDARVNSVNDQRNAALARKEYDEAREAYENHPVNRLQRAGSDIKTWTDQAGKDIGKAASDAKTWGEQAVKDVGTAANNAKDWVGKRFSDAKNWGTQAVSDARRWTNENVLGSTKNDYDLNMARATAAGRNPDSKASQGQIPALLRTAPELDRKSAQRAEDTERTYRDNAAEAKRTYDNSLVGRAEKAAKDVGKAAKNAGDWVGERAKDVGNAVGTAAKNVGDAVGKAAKDVGEWGKGAVDKGRDFITGLFGKKKKG